MVDTSRTRFPETMTTLAHEPQPGTLETYAQDLVEKVKDYAREEPISFGLVALGVGFVLGWRLKPW